MTTRESGYIALCAVAFLALSCRDRSPPPQTRREEPPPFVPADPELGFPDVVRHIESGEVTWIVPIQDRRVFITLKSGDEHVTTAPTDTALEELVKRVDPSKETIVVARKYATYKEMAWKDVPAFIAKSTILVVQQNGGRRVAIETVDEQFTPSGFYVTMQPKYGDITPMVPKRYPSGLYVKHINVREVSWQTATEELTLDNVSNLFLAHGDLVYFDTKDGRQLMTIEPTPEAANAWLKVYRPDFRSITVE